MLIQEFTNRVKVQVSAEEFEAINTVYMASDLNKDEFCAMWRKMNASRVKAAKEAERLQKEAEARFVRLWKVEQKLFLATAYYAVDVLSESEIKDLHAVNIATKSVRTLCNGETVNFFHSACSVWQDLHNFLMSA